jgi:hypothetical protein
MAMLSQFIGSGLLALKDTANNAYQAGVLQGVTFDFQSDIKELIGDKKIAILTAEVGRKYKVSAKYAQLSSALVGAVMGATKTTGSKVISTVRKTATASAFTIAAADEGTPAGWAFVADLGAKYATNGQDLKFNSGTLAATGEYKNTAAAYTTGSGEATIQLDVTYVFSQTAGETWTAQNQAIGLSTYFAMRGYQATTQADGTVRKIAWHFPAVLIPGLKLGFQNTEFATQDLELSVFADSTGMVAEFTAI